MKFAPLNDRILVRREEPTRTGSIIIPPTAKDKPTQGRVLAAGPGRTLDNGLVKPVGVKEGDLILFGQYAGQDIQINGEDFLIIQESDVLGVLG